MKKHLTTIMAMAAALSMPLSAMAQDAVDADTANAAVTNDNAAAANDSAAAGESAAAPSDSNAQPAAEAASDTSAPSESAAPAAATAATDAPAAPQESAASAAAAPAPAAPAAESAAAAPAPAAPAADSAPAAAAAASSEPAAAAPAPAAPAAESAPAAPAAAAASSEPAAAAEDTAVAAAADAKDASDDDDDDDDEDADEKDDDKSWTVGASASFDLGLGAFQKDKYAKRIRSRFAFKINGGYTIPVIDVDIHADTGFSQWMSKAGGSNGQYEFRWADSNIGLSRNIWSYKDGGFKVSFDADLSFALPTSTASINSKLYTTISPSLAASIKFHKLLFAYGIAYGHSFHKYTSITYDPSEVDVLSRSTGNELIGSHDIAIGGVLSEIELANEFALGYQFIPQLGLTIGFGFIDVWTYDNGTITKDDEFVNPNAKVGRGHSQLSQGSVMLIYNPHKWVTLQLAMVSTQPWKTADNKTLRFPWFDTVSPSKNYTKFIFAAAFQY